MVDRPDPARAGVTAGRVVGLLTALLVVASLLRTQASFYAVAEELLGPMGLGDRAATLWFWTNVAFGALARYSVCYVAGSLVGVVYDWLDRPPLPVLMAMVALVGLGDATLAYLDTFDPLIAGGYVVAWLCYVPVFVHVFDAEAEPPSGPRRLGES